MYSVTTVQKNIEIGHDLTELQSSIQGDLFMYRNQTVRILFVMFTEVVLVHS